MANSTAAGPPTAGPPGTPLMTTERVVPLMPELPGGCSALGVDAVHPSPTHVKTIQARANSFLRMIESFEKREAACGRRPPTWNVPEAHRLLVILNIRNS